MHRTRARPRPRRGRRGCGRFGLGYVCRRFCGVGHGLLPYIVLLWVKGELRLRGRFFLRGRQVVVALFQFIPHGAHCPHSRRCGCDETGQQCQCKAPAAQKLFNLLHCRYSHLLHCVRIASGLSVGQQGRFYAFFYLNALRVALGCTFTGMAAAGKCIFPLWPSVLIPGAKRRIF